MDEVGAEEREQMNAQNDAIKDHQTKQRVAKLEAKLNGMAQMKNTP